MEFNVDQGRAERMLRELIYGVLSGSDRNPKKTRDPRRTIEMVSKGETPWRVPYNVRTREMAEKLCAFVRGEINRCGGVNEAANYWERVEEKLRR